MRLIGILLLAFGWISVGWLTWNLVMVSKDERQPKPPAMEITDEDIYNLIDQEKEK